MPSCKLTAVVSEIKLVGYAGHSARWAAGRERKEGTGSGAWRKGEEPGSGRTGEPCLVLMCQYKIWGIGSVPCVEIIIIIIIITTTSLGIDDCKALSRAGERGRDWTFIYNMTV